MPRLQLVQFKDAPIGAVLITECGQRYRKDSSRTLSMAPGHSHYVEGTRRWFYVKQDESFRMEVTE